MDPVLQRDDGSILCMEERIRQFQGGVAGFRIAICTLKAESTVRVLRRPGGVATPKPTPDIRPAALVELAKKISRTPMHASRTAWSGHAIPRQLEPQGEFLDKRAG
jgi:hypothetical protein